MSFLNGTDPGLRQTRTPTVDLFTAGVDFTAGSSTQLTLTNDPGTENNVIITFDGIVQHRNTYTVSGAVVTFDAAIGSGVSNVEATYTTTIPAATPADNSVTLAKLSDGTQGGLIYYGGSGAPTELAAGTSGQFLQTQGAASNPQWATLSAASEHGANTTLSGTSADFTGITSGTTWIDLMLIDVSNNSTTAATIVQLGDSGGIETTGYDSQTRANDTSTSGFLINGAGHTAYTVTGIFKFRLKNPATNEWIMYGGGTRTTTDSDATDSWGHKQLSGELTQLRITNESGATFDAGSANILYGGS